MAPETDVAALAPDRPLRDQIDLDSLDWLNLVDILAPAHTVAPAELGPDASLDSLSAALAAQAGSAAAAAPVAPGPAAVHRVADGREVRLRPLCADDAPLEADFVRLLSSESRYKRFMASLSELPPAKLRYLTQIDQIHHLAIAGTTMQGGRETLVGVARCIADPGGSAAEFAVTVADDWQRTGLAGLLMRALIDAARAHGLTELYGIVLASNRQMLQFVRQLGFALAHEAGDAHLVRAVRRL
ncbi:MAG: N-acetyltransferase family protein [Caldimonas sp.]